MTKHTDRVKLTLVASDIVALQIACLRYESILNEKGLDASAKQYEKLTQILETFIPEYHVDKEG